MACVSSTAPISSRSDGSRTANAKNATAARPSTTTTFDSRRRTSASRAVSSARSRGSSRATMTLDEVLDKLRKRAHQPLTEVHVVNGLHPDLPFSYYTDLLRGLKGIRPE